METSSELSDEKIDAMNLNLSKRLRACTKHKKTYVKNAGGRIACVAEKDAAKYVSREGWSLPSEKELATFLNGGKEPKTESSDASSASSKSSDDADDNSISIDATTIRQMNTKTLEKFLEKYGEQIEADFAEDDTLPQKKDKVIKALELEE